MSISISRRLQRFGEMWNRHWDFVLLVVVLVIAILAVVSSVKAVLLTPVAIEQRQRLEQQFDQNRREAIEEYETDGEDRGSGGVQEAAAEKP